VKIRASWALGSGWQTCGSLRGDYTREEAVALVGRQITAEMAGSRHLFDWSPNTILVVAEDLGDGIPFCDCPVIAVSNGETARNASIDDGLFGIPFSVR
jgi:hypothetical protein